MSIKVLVVLSLIAVAACSPAPLTTGISVGVQSNGTGLVGGLLSGIFGTINGVATLAIGALNAVLNLTIGALTDVFTLIVNLSLVLQVTLNNLVAGLGSLFIRLVACIIKIAVCVLGFPGDKGICAAGWNAKFGISGEASTAANLVILFKLNNAQTELNGYINTISNGKGTSSTTGSVKTVLEKITTLVSFITNYQQISKKTVTDTFIIITTVSGCISNSRQANSGVQIIKKIVPECGKYFKLQGYADITLQITTITNDCSSSNGDNINWNGTTSGTAGGTTTGTTGGTTTGTTGGTNTGTTGSITTGTTGGTTTGTTGTSGGTTTGTTVGTTTGTTGGTTTGTTGGTNTGTSGGTTTGTTGGTTTGTTGGTTTGTTGGTTTGTTGGTTTGTIGGTTSGSTGVSVGVGVGRLINGIFGAINGVVSLASSALSTVLNITIGALNDVFKLIVNLSLVLQVILNNLVAGLGSLFVRLVACIVKIAVCILGLPGDSGICAAGWNAQFGISGEASTAADLVILFRLNNAQVELNGYINTISNGKGTSSTTGSVKTVLEKITTLVSFITNYQQISKTTVTDTFIIITTVSGCISNSRQANSGVQIIQQIVPACGKYFTQQGYADITLQITTITNACSSSNGDNINWNGTTSGTTGGTTTGTTGGTTTGTTGGSTTSTTGGTTTGTTGGTNTGTSGGTTTGTTGGTATGTTGGTTTGTTGGTTTGTTGGTTTGTTGGTTTGTTGGTTTTTTSTGGVDFGVSIGGIIKLIPGVTSIASNIINEIIKIKINTFVDIVNLVTKLAIALGGIIDSVIIGLGSILIRIVAVIFKIGYCVNGVGSDTSICTAEWNAQFGITGDATTAADLISLFRVNNCKDDVATSVSTYTNGKGISSVSGAINVVLQKVTDLSVIVSSGTISKANLSSVFLNVISIFGSIANSYKQGSGTVLVLQLIPVCAPILVKQGLTNITVQLVTLVATINTGNNDKYNWQAVVSGGNNISDELVTDIKTVFTSLSSSKYGLSLTALLNLQVPRSFDDVCSFGVQIVQALGGILDVFINGLGTLIVRIVGCLINYIVAVLGVARNAKSFVSQKAYYDIFGVTVSGSTWVDLAAGFKINNAKADLDAILNVYTNSKGFVSLSGVKLVLFNCAYSLVDIVSKGTGIVEADLTAVFRIVTTIVGGFANSCSANVGKTICDNMVPVVNFYLEKNGYISISSSESVTIDSTIATCNNSDAPWVSVTTTTVVSN